MRLPIFTALFGMLSANACPLSDLLRPFQPGCFNSLLSKSKTIRLEWPFDIAVLIYHNPFQRRCLLDPFHLRAFDQSAPVVGPSTHFKRKHSAHTTPCNSSAPLTAL
ncbi:hypothetical protein BKA66DRAFT_131070 [Pyrenochaeta sp. MPI-SDFR-AT-0127]|nr:hypothetical protein BKA66DRAFT_131070 [Pyrenochaeta sp. MPI-SDFR-AT-0127]